MSYQPGIYKEQGGTVQVFKDGSILYFGTDKDVAVTFDGTETTATMTQTAWNSRAMYYEGYPTATTVGCRNGVLGVMSYRDAAYPLASWDGNGDIAFRAWAYNYAANTTARGGTRAMEVLARNRTGSCSWVNAGYFTAENYTGSAGVDSVIGLEVHAKNNAVAATKVACLRLYDESQSATGTSYAIDIDCTGESAFAREFCIHIDTVPTTNGTGTWTNGVTFDGNVTNPLDFADADGTNGATYSAGHYASLGNIDGKIQVDIGGNTLFLPAYASIAA